MLTTLYVGNLQKIKYKKASIQMLTNAQSMLDKMDYMLFITFAMVPLKTAIGSVQNVINAMASSNVTHSLVIIIMYLLSNNRS